MKWSLQQLSVAKRKPFTFEEEIDLSSLKELNPEIRSVSPVIVKGEVNYSGTLITFQLSIVGELILPCVRTLADVKFPIDLQITEHFHPTNDYVTADVDHDEINFFEGETVDLLPVIKERILLEIPIQVYAETEEERLAPPSGKDWGLVTEEEHKNRVDPRLADLAKFFEKE
ncbi:DUF177 domain-containing protein [Alkalihalobacillus sp. MEB130]|uniref:YceD family protein n=1 Tax=Alkalihalobacillus sp. MEB130 TaxID=2976704 RepID=UPI0028E02B71|nr:DUF177 domain-containing protein [Alkalihalobacillus sp. MEB130]MDT8859137.1 DUF177 domain-containing protein [Alkalihalobacillus sp. MEB130]